MIYKIVFVVKLIVYPFILVFCYDKKFGNRGEYCRLDHAWQIKLHFTMHLKCPIL